MKMTLTCPYCGQQVSIRDKECRECGCPMSTILSELIVETTKSAGEALAAHGISVPEEKGGASSGASSPVPAYGAPLPGGDPGMGMTGAAGSYAMNPTGAGTSAYAHAQGPISVYLTEMTSQSGDPRMLFLFEELAAAAEKVREARKQSSLYKGNLILLGGKESLIAGAESRLATLQAEYRQIGGLFSGGRRERKMREINAAKARIEELKRNRDYFRQRNIPANPGDLEARLSSARQEEERVRNMIVARQGAPLTEARNAIMNDGSLLARAITDPTVFAYLDRDLFFRTGLDPSGPAVRALAAYPEALARLQVNDLPEDLLEQVEGSYRTSVLGSYGWTPSSLAGWIGQCCREQPSLAGYEIRKDVLPAYLGVKGQHPADRPVELLLLKDGRPVLAVHTAPTRDAKKGMAYVKRACRKRGIAYTHLLTEYPNYRHYVVRRLLTALGEL